MKLRERRFCKLKIWKEKRVGCATYEASRDVPPNNPPIVDAIIIDVALMRYTVEVRCQLNLKR